MFRKNKNTTAIDTVNNTQLKKMTPSVISSGTHILGNIVSDGAVDIDGSVEGNIKGDQVTIRSNGKISGDIIANVAHVYGEVRGLIRSHAVHLYSSAQVTGVIVHQSLTVEDGAFLDAKFKRMNETSGESAADGDNADENGFIESAPSFVSNGTLRLIG